MRRLLTAPRARLAALLLTLALAYVAPRVVAYQGIARMDRLHFGDMPLHLSNADRIHQLHQLPASQLDHPFFTAHPHLVQYNAIGWPPAVYQLTSLWYGQLEPLSIWVALLTNGVFSLVLLAGLAGLGRAMGSLRAGLWAGLLALLCPPLAGSTWFYGLDYPLVAMTTVGLLWLWHTQRFHNLHAAVLLGAWSGLGLSVKSGYPIYLLMPALLSLGLGLWRPRRGRLRVLGHAALATAVALGLAYGVRDISLPQLWHTLVEHTAATTDKLPAAISIWGLDGWVALPKFILSCYPAPLLLAALPGLALLHRRGAGAPPCRALLLAAWWGTLLLLLILDNKMERYLHPLYPLLCLATAWWGATRLAPRLRTAALSALAALYAAALVAVYLHPTPWLPHSEAFSSDIMLYDLRPPARARLQDVRQRKGSRDTDLLAAGLVQLARVDTARRPLGVVALTGQDEHLPWDHKDAVIVARRRLQDRFVTSVDLGSSKVMPPAAILIHPAGQGPRRINPAYRAAGSRRLQVFDHQLVLRLYLTRGAGTRLLLPAAPRAQ